MKPAPHAIALLAGILTLSMFSAAPAAAEEAKPARFEPADSKGVQATRDDRSVYLSIDADVKGPITIPRLAAPLRSMRWEGSDNDDISLNPGQDAWQVRWKGRQAGASVLVLEFDDRPLLLHEVKPVAASADGSFYLSAHLAKTNGEKIRYEPQPFKNTVGYWAGRQDTATWSFKLDKPGRFNVAILQGCGKGQGGTAGLSFVNPNVEGPVPVLRFEVEETGHFQNFQWRTLGAIELKHTGQIELVVKPEQIKNFALIDIRAIHLVRLPDP